MGDDTTAHDMNAQDTHDHGLHAQSTPAQEAPRLGISGRIARFFLTSQLTPLLALVLLQVAMIVLGHLQAGVVG